MAQSPVWTLSRYVLRRHLAPFGFALAGLTSLMLFNQITKQLPSLLGKGLPSGAILAVFVLSVPFIVAVTLPMAVLIAVLHVFSRLASDGEIAAITGGSVRILRLITPVLGAAASVAALSLLWNDQILPRANHRLRTLQVRLAGVTPSWAIAPETDKSDREMTIAELRRAVTSAREDADRAAGDGRAAIEGAARRRAAASEVEIQKKYAIAAACLVFALFGAAIGLRFQGGGVGLVVAVSSVVFTLYYVGLIGGEELGGRLVVSPFFAMWTANLILGTVGLGAFGLIRKPVSVSITKRPVTSRGPLPHAARLAAWTLAGYGAANFLYTVFLETRLASGQPALSEAAARFLAVGLIAWGLLNRARWAWWAGVLSSSLGLVACLGGLGVLVALADGVRARLLPDVALLLVLCGLASAAVLALLLAPSSRAAFRGPAR